MNILVTGANGQLGNEIRIASLKSSDSYIFTDVNKPEGTETEILDITDLDAIRSVVRERNVKAIVNCAAYTNVEGAEDNPELAEKLNAEAVGNLATAMKEADGVLVHISTDYVFGGDPYNTPCTEERTGTPTGVYGITKLHGEQAVAHTGCRHIIIRTAWLYSEFGKNFVKTMLSLTSTRDTLKVVFDQAGTPTYALDLAKAIVKILDGRLFEGHDGIYHFSNEGVCSWYDFTKAIYEKGQSLGLVPADAHCNILPCHSDEFPSKVTRPAYSVLDKTKIKNTFGIDVPYWTDSLHECLNNMKSWK